ncbi:MAG: hypothetical protein D6722_07180 [Bacteroidetes bacterium]|nr:MAG: hypothetical protein D6722_07180 [Bacteroidota bacterium]
MRLWIFLLLALPAFSLSAQSATPCGLSEVSPVFDRTHARFHRYAVLTPLGPGDSTHARALFAHMMAEKQLVAPVLKPYRGPVAPCDTVEVRIGPTRHNPILMVVDTAHRAFINQALPGHILYPGWVRREVILQEGVLHIRTTSEGSGRLPRLDERMGPRYWRKLDVRIKRTLDNHGY